MEILLILLAIEPVALWFYVKRKYRIGAKAYIDKRTGKCVVEQGKRKEHQFTLSELAERNNKQ